MIELPHLPIYKFQLLVQTSQAISPHSFIEATFRGGLGYVLKRECPYAPQKEPGDFPQSDCKHCPERTQCLYPVLFDPIPGIGQENRSEDIPRPWSIFADIEEGSIILEFTLFGENKDKIPKLIDALKELGIHGIGKFNVPYKITGVSEIQSSSLDKHDKEHFQEAAKDILLEVTTPMALRKQGKKLLHWDTDAFVRATLRRIYLLSVHQNVDIPPSWNYKAILDLFQQVKSESQSSVFSQSRNSTRQKANINYSGFVGRILLRNVPTEAFPVIKAASRLGVGAGTVFGCGRIKILGIF